MALFEITIALLAVGALLAALARRLQAPYPAFLALAGAALALVPGTPELALSPDLVLTLFVAPTLLNAAYDASPRDMRKQWVAIVGSAVLAVGVTVVAVALAARWLRPDMPWPVAVVLGAIVGPSDASAATAVLRALRPPHRVMVIVEGESLFNDATALLIYRAGLGIAAGSWAGWNGLFWLLLSLVGGIGLGLVAGKLYPRLIAAIEDGPTAVIAQFGGTFALWILASRIGVSPILSLLFFAMTVARYAPSRQNARLRIQSYAVWDVGIFVLNVLAFILVGLQLRPILSGLGGWAWQTSVLFGTVILAVCILVRMGFVTGITAIRRSVERRLGRALGGADQVPTTGGAVVIGWCGMRGIVTLATALALPQGFPFRDLVLFGAFAVVLGTLVIQGITLRPLLAALDLPEEDIVGSEAALARLRAAEAALAVLQREADGAAPSLLAEYEGRRRLWSSPDDPDPADAEHHAHRSLALRVERRTVLELRRRGEIGEDAFHVVEEELDWAEMDLARRVGPTPRR